MTVDLRPPATAAAPAAPIAPTAHPYRWVVLAGVWLAYFSFGLTTVTLAPLVEVVGEDLGLGHARMGTVLGAWQLVYIGSALPCGMLLDRAGPRWALFLALAVIAASNGLRGAANGHLGLFLAVALFGLGGPLVSIGAPKLTSLWFEGRERGFAMGVYITGLACGNMAAFALTNSVFMPALGGDWRAVLWADGALVLATGLIWLAMTAHPVYRAVEAERPHGPQESQVQMFVRLLGVPAVRWVLVMSIGIFFFNHALDNWLPAILISRGMEAVRAGYWATVPTAIGVGAALVLPRLATPPRRLLVLGALYAAAAGATLLLHGAEGAVLGAGLVLQGMARGAMMAVAMLILIEIPEVGPRRAGLAGGLFFSSAEIGGVAGPVAVGLIADASGGFTMPLAVLTGICLALVAMLAPLARGLRR